MTVYAAAFWHECGTIRLGALGGVRARERQPNTTEYI
jgi:hypothetical protein